MAGDAYPTTKVVRGELARSTQGVEVAGLSREKVEEMFSDTIDQVRADLAGLSRN